MKKSNYIFKLSKISGKPEKSGFLSAIVTESQNEIGALIGTPCIVDKYTYEKSPESIPTLFTFPLASGKRPNNAYSLRNHRIKAVSESFISMHKTKVISKLDMSKFENLSEYVSKHGSITFRLSEFDCPYTGIIFARRFVMETLPDIIGRFENHTVQEMLYYSDSKPYFKDVSCHLTFLDIRHCLPVFSAIKSVKGMCLMLKVGSERLYKEVGRDIDYFTMSMVFSNKLEGVFFVDGVQISNISKMSKTAIKNLDRWIEKVLEKKKEKNKKKAGDKIRYTYKLSDSTSAYLTASDAFTSSYITIS